MASSIVGRTFAATATATTAAARAPRFQSAARKLAKHGVEALKPSCTIINRQRYPNLNLQGGGDDGGASTKAAAIFPPEATVLAMDKIWRSPVISKRKANVMRKQAIADGVYGTFNAETGVGWDATWDVELAKSKQGGGRGRYRMSVPKKTKRNRIREERAVKIEMKLQGMDERIDDYYRAKHAKKPEPTFENKYKELMRAKKK
jgi:hypothetical protein